MKWNTSKFGKLARVMQIICWLLLVGKTSACYPPCWFFVSDLTLQNEVHWTGQFSTHINEGLGDRIGYRVSTSSVRLTRSTYDKSFCRRCVYRGKLPHSCRLRLILSPAFEKCICFVHYRLRDIGARAPITWKPLLDLQHINTHNILVMGLFSTAPKHVLPFLGHAHHHCESCDLHVKHWHCKPEVRSSVFAGRGTLIIVDLS